MSYSCPYSNGFFLIFEFIKSKFSSFLHYYLLEAFEEIFLCFLKYLPICLSPSRLSSIFKGLSHVSNWLKKTIHHFQIILILSLSPLYWGYEIMISLFQKKKLYKNNLPNLWQKFLANIKKKKKKRKKERIKKEN